MMQGGREKPQRRLQQSQRLSAMTLSVEPNITSLASMSLGKRVVVMARHGERQDYVDKACGKNWIPTTNRPWDPPLSQNGVQTSRSMGRAICTFLETHGLPPVTRVYSSPLIRCRQTAAAAIESINQDDDAIQLKVQVEDGLMESVNASWYGSWCLSTSDSTWGFRPWNADASRRLHLHEIDDQDIHEAAKKPIQELLDRNLLYDQDDAFLSDAMSVEYKSKSKLEKPYCWGYYETRQEQRTRMRKTMELLSKENETTLCVSHGGPITHLYEELTENSWSEHGESTYTCISIYVQESIAGEWKPLVVNDSTHVDELQ